MKRIVAAMALVGVVVLLASMFPQAVRAAEDSAKAGPPAERVVVMYFHRTQRCPTCLKMGSYSEEAVKSGFAQELKAGKVEFHYIDFQNKKNQALTKGYKVDGPSLVVARVADNKVAEHKSLADIWTKVGDQKGFIKYVQDNVKDYHK